ncbi:hypothetical protein J2T04_001621 [Chryseobacterium lathyri]|uniref:Uncharacterized protein n=1 Tax=Chryseobacterium lathyri TaxID=395933 RepID=A0ABT9SL70_9FLAO|nr:hypothetical protein [Chryseobacterium lathyri]
MSEMFQNIKSCAAPPDRLLAFQMFIKSMISFFLYLKQIMFGKANKSTIFIFIKENTDYAD